jgi:peptidylprolyl isomerase
LKRTLLIIILTSLLAATIVAQSSTAAKVSKAPAATAAKPAAKPGAKAAVKGAPRRPATPAEQIQQLEQKWFTGIIRNDSNTVTSLLADDFVIIDHDGKPVSRAEFITRLTENRLVLGSIKTAESKVRFYGTTAINQSRATFLRDGNTIGEAVLTEVWVKVRGLWKLASVDSLPTLASGEMRSPNLLIGSREIVTSSGLRYEDLTPGSGDSPKPGQTVIVHYVGTLLNGNKFDSSRDRNRPFEFEIGEGRVIRGWDEGVMSMKMNGKRKLIIPPHLGYGSRDMGVIPPNSTLVFEVELLGVK